MKIDRDRKNISFIHSKELRRNSLLIDLFSSFVSSLENIESPTHDSFPASKSGLSKILLFRVFPLTIPILRRIKGELDVKER